MSQLPSSVRKEPTTIPTPAPTPADKHGAGTYIQPRTGTQHKTPAFTASQTGSNSDTTNAVRKYVLLPKSLFSRF